LFGAALGGGIGAGWIELDRLHTLINNSKSVRMTWREEGKWLKGGRKEI